MQTTMYIKLKSISGRKNREVQIVDFEHYKAWYDALKKPSPHFCWRLSNE